MGIETTHLPLTADGRAVRVLRWLPSPALLFAVAIGGVMAAVNVAKGFQDPDYFWHVTTGHLIVSTGHIPSVDPFSFTWAGQPWTLHEWLSEVLIYLLVTAFGQLGALVVFGVLPALIFGALIYALRRREVGLLALGLAVGLAAWSLIPYVTLRPQAVSWFLLAVLLGFLWSLGAAHPRRVLWLIPFFTLWANLHGLYVVGLGVVGLYLLFTLGRSTPMAPAWRWMLVGTIGAFLASALTPAGPIGLLYPLRYLGIGGGAGAWGLKNIAEWQSPNFHDPANLGLLAFILAVAANLRRATPGWLATLSYLGIAMALVALRNTPVAAVFAVPTLALGIDARLQARRQGASRPAYRPDLALARRVMEATLAVVVIVASIFIVVPHSPGSRISADIAERFPVAAVDWLEAHDPTARVLAEYGWGGYVIYRMNDGGGRVFVDGRNDMYSEQILDDYSSIRNADPGWQQLAASYGVQAILFPPTVFLVRGPAQAAGWCVAYEDATQVLLLPSCPG
jgi:hypothetical protein